MRFWLISNNVERSMASTDPTSLGTRNEGYPSFMMILPQTPTNNRGKRLKIGARIVRHGGYAIFQLAEVAVPRALFAAILRQIDRLRGPPVAVA